MRHLAQGGGIIRELEELRAPMSSVLDFFINQKSELDRYKAKYGELSSSSDSDEEDNAEDEEDEEEEEEDDNSGDTRGEAVQR